MNIKQIQGWIKEAHENAMEKGFYDCPECIDRISFYDSCDICNGRRIDQNKNIGELLMLIVSELGEALEAHRCGRFPDYKKYEFSIEEITADMKSDGRILRESAVAAYGECIKDTFEDEIADVFIRLFDLCGYLEIELEQPEPVLQYKKNDNLGDSFLYVSGLLSDIRISPKVNFYYQSAFLVMVGICQKYNIPIEEHIDAKMVYNKTRQKLHGKKY